MTPSEESMTLMTSYHFPHHGNRSFAIASGWRLMVFFITAASLRHRFGVTLIVSRHSERWQECCSRKTGNGTVTQSEESMILMTSYHFPPTVTDPSLSLQDDVLWSSTSLRGDAYRQSSFWTVARMLFKKNGKRDSDTEWRIYDSDDILPLSSPQVQSLHIRFGWRLTFSSLQQQILCWYFVWHLMEIICFGF